MRYTISFVLATVLAQPGLAEVPKVVTDFAPIQSLTAMVMGDLGEPSVLLPAGGDPHDFQLRPSQAQMISDADLIFWNGPDLMPALDEALNALEGSAKTTALLHDGGGKTRDFAGGEGVDPHAWLDPTNAQAWLQTIAARLAAKDPENAATYAANATQAQTQIATLDADLATLLAPARGVPIVEFHDAFGYFADHYGLNIVGTVELGDASSPTAARLAEIRDILASTNPVCIFPEAGRDPKLIEAVTEGSTARIGAGQDPEAAMLADTPVLQIYPTLMRNLAQTIADCIAG